MDKIQQAFDWAINQVKTYLPDFTSSFPYSHSENNFYAKSENVEWTTGFWTGIVWLCYEKTQNEDFKIAAESQVHSFFNRIVNKIDTNHHDMGFLYSPSCVAAYKLTGNEEGRKAALLAADNLISRFQSVGQFIQAWGNLGDEDNYRLIIDCLLNLPLLFWASETTKDDKYKEVALAHIDTAMKVIIRDDDSTYHTYYFDKKTGLPTKGITRQGYRDGSAWSRGQAWGIYGSAIAYHYTKNEKYFDLFKRMTNFFLTHLPQDLLPYWDFDFSTGSTEPRDSSASAIAICGMLEMSKYLPEKESLYYTTKAKELLNVLIDTCAVKDTSVSNGLLLHGTYARKSPYNPCNDRGVDECNTWGDYYYLEALMRLSKDWDSYW
jgi:unsaturated chondroitin disaccharide hydrolase